MNNPTEGAKLSGALSFRQDHGPTNLWRDSFRAPKGQSLIANLSGKRTEWKFKAGLSAQVTVLVVLPMSFLSFQRVKSNRIWPFLFFAWH